MIEVMSIEEMQEFGRKIGQVAHGGTVIELIGDVGAGKTTLTKGIAAGLGITEAVQSPTFTISRQYEVRDGLLLAHYDFYRLEDAGIMSEELAEVIDSAQVITVIEWSNAVKDILPADRLTITLTSPTEQSRHLELHAGGVKSQRLVKELE